MQNLNLFVLFCFVQTDGSVPNTLVIANCEIVKPRVAAAEHISQVSPKVISTLYIVSNLSLITILCFCSSMKKHDHPM